MNDSLRQHLISYRNEMSAIYDSQLERYSQLAGYEDMRLKRMHYKNGADYYAVLNPELKKYKYLGTGKHPEVLNIKEAHYLRLSLSELNREITLIDNLLSRCTGIGYSALNDRLPKAYRNAPILYISTG